MATIPVHSGDNLQTALTNASAGDTLVLDAGATFTGHFTIGAKAAPGVTVTTSGTLPDRRIVPADASLLPTIASPDSTAQMMGTGATYWTFDGIQFAPTPTGNNQCIQLQGADHITLDRILIVGGANGQKRGVMGNGTNITVRRSYIANCWWPGTDSQAFAAWDGAGPYTLQDTFFEAASEPVLFGGSDPSSSANIPSDILVEGCYCTKKFAWVGTTKNVKNLFELKNAKRVIVRNNTFDGNWSDPSGQSGYAIVFTPRNQGNTAPYTVVEDVLFEHNVVKNTNRGFNLLGHDYPNTSGQMTRVTIRNNLVICDQQTAQWFAYISGDIGELTIDHNTIVQGGTILELYNTPACEDFTFTNNLCVYHNYGVHSPVAAEGQAALAYHCTAYTWTHNVVAAPPYWAGLPSPEPLTFKPDLATYNAQFNADYTLVDGSIYIGAGSDGFDLGVIWNEDSGTPPGPPPPPWLNRDIGTTTVAGTTTWASDVFTVSGEGADIGGTADSFQLAWQLVDINTDYEIVARVTAVENTNSLAKAGIMLRGWSAAYSAHVSLVVRPDGTTELLTRATDNATTTQVKTQALSLPVWLRLRLFNGVAFTAISTDGLTWVSWGQLPVAFPVNVFGMVVCSKSAGVLNDSTFDNVSIQQLQPTLPPAPWSNQDIGSPALSGNASYDSTAEAFSVTGDGAQIFGTTDAFQCVSQPIQGNCQIIARVTELENTGATAEAGIMVRASLDADAAHSFITMYPNADIQVFARPTTGATTGIRIPSQASGGFPVWLRMIRIGSSISVDYSTDGAEWISLGSNTTPTIPLAAYVALVVSSQSGTKLTNAVFDNVSVLQSAPTNVRVDGAFVALV